MKVTILMSTYNGQKYVEEQIKSILSQTEKDIELIIRDDGSKDNTLNILKKYEKMYSNIKVIKGSNIGVEKSFMELVKNSTDSEYYAFSDQDDIWEKLKIEKALMFFDKKDNKPSLYYSEVKAVDSNLKFLFKSNYVGIDTLGASFSTTPVIGCTVIFNKSLRDLIVNNYLPNNIVMHDLYMYRLCLAVGGNVLHDHESYILYRQHSNNVVGITNSIKKK